MTQRSAGPAANAVPFAVASLAILLLSAMDAVMKGLTLSIGVYNTMLWRSGISVIVGGGLFLATRAPWPGTAILRMHIWRGAVMTVMALCFFWGIGRLPLAEAIALTFVAPLIALYLAAALLGEKVGPNAIGGSAVAFLGVILIVATRARMPADGASLEGAVAVLVSALLYAYNIILMREQALMAGPVEIAFFQNAVIGVLLLLAAPLLAVVPGAQSLPALGLASALSFGGALLFAWAYARGEAQQLAPTEYTGLIWAAIFGWLAFGEAVTVTTIVGGILIVAGCLIAARTRPATAQPMEAAL